MKTIAQIEKKSKSIRVIVEEITYAIEPEMMIKYQLKTGLTISDSEWNKMMLENQYLQCLRFAYLKLKKMLTIHEMKIILEDTSFPLGIQKQVIHTLIEKKYLDDYAYTKTFIELKKFKEGPEMINYHLLQKGISLDIIESMMTHYKENEVITYLVEKQMSSPTKKPKKARIQQIKSQLLAKGFHREMIESIMMDHLDKLDDNDLDLIFVYGAKYIKQYQTKLTGYPLYQKVKEKLYQKGFSYDDIKRYLASIDLHSW